MLSNRPAYERGILQEEPLAQLYEDLEQGIITEEEFDSQAFHRRLDISEISVIEGSYYFEYKTVNRSDGNTTLGRGVITFSRDENDHDNMHVTAEGRTSAGTNYNKETTNTWTGKLNIETGKIDFDEKYASHRGLFIYTGERKDNNHWDGTYYWDIKPAAVGNFSLIVYTFPSNRTKSAR